MHLEHFGKGYLITRHEGEQYLLGRVVEHETYTYQEGDLFLPYLGGIFVADDLRNAILDGSFKGRLVPYHMLVEPMRIVG
jgi:hypothetical protein